MSRLMTEAKMLPVVKRLFPAIHYHRRTEVALASKQVDLCAFPKDKTNPPIAIELKVYRWRKALWQAIVYRQVFSLSYVALWHEYLHRADLDLFAQAGVGLISVQESAATIVLQAKPSPNYQSGRIKKLTNWPAE